MKLCIARDKNGDLYLYFGKPTKVKECGSWISHESGIYAFLVEDTEELSQIKWEDEAPTEVELKIKEK